MQMEALGVLADSREEAVADTDVRNAFSPDRTERLVRRSRRVFG